MLRMGDDVGSKGNPDLSEPRYADYVRLETDPCSTVHPEMYGLLYDYEHSLPVSYDTVKHLQYLQRIGMLPKDGMKGERHA